MGFYKSFRIANILTNLFSSKNLVKIVLFGVILLIIGLLFSNNVFAVEDVSLTRVDHITAHTNPISYGGSCLYYFYADNKYIYTITNNIDSNISIRVCNSTPNIGVSFSDLTIIPPGGSYVFAGGNYYTFNSQNGESDESFVSVTRDFINSYDKVTDDLTSELTFESLWTQFGYVIPLIGVAVLFAIGYVIVKKLIPGTSKGKVKF